MDEIITKILSIVSDYHYDATPPFKMTEEHIKEWVNQFDVSDRTFVLQELYHILQNGIYISKDKARKLLIKGVVALSEKLSYKTVQEFIKETVFLSIQPKGKSQGILLSLLDEELTKEYGFPLAQCGVFEQKNFVYIDDILASGRTVLRDCKAWFAESDNLKKCEQGTITFSIITFCKHQWAVDRIRWSLKLHFKSDFFTRTNRFWILGHYRIDDNARDNSPKLNVACPIKSKPDWETYLASLDGATDYEDRAYRQITRPKEEDFFSNAGNRNRFEQILMDKGIQIINKIKDVEKRINHRPLGNTYSRYRTFCTGTLFFTWLNISNTCPIVFWWDNPAHNWKGLFPLINRGN